MRGDGPLVSSLTSTSDAGAVYGRIRQAIIEGRHPPGARLVEQRLAEELDVSRTPVREAVRRLESEGLVVVERNRGAHVRPLDEAEIADLYEARARLEAYGAELAAARATAEEVAALHGAAASFRDALAPIEVPDRVGSPAEASPPASQSLDPVRSLDAANAAFHEALLVASHHGRIRQLVLATVDAPLVFAALARFEPAELERSALFHDLIAEAVAAGEAARAGRLMTEHVLQGRDALLQRLVDVGGIADLFAASA